MPEMMVSPFQIQRMSDQDLLRLRMTRPNLSPVIQMETMRRSRMQPQQQPQRPSSPIPPTWPPMQPQAPVAQPDTAQTDELGDMAPAAPLVAATDAATQGRPQVASDIQMAARAAVGAPEKARDAPDWAMPLIVAGLTMAASKSPGFAGAIGEGGLAGIRQMTLQQRAAADEKATKRDLDIKERRVVAEENAARAKRGPESTLGKLYADHQAGLLTDEQYRAAVAKETHVADSARSEVARLMTERDALPANDPRRKIYDDAINKATTTPREGQDFQQANALRDEFTATAKDFRTIQDAYAKIKEAAAGESGAGDMSMLYAYVRMLDPGSVVRESEFAMAAQSGSLGERVQGAVNKILSGERLPPTLRESFLSEAQKIYGTQRKQYGSIKDQYTKLAQRWGIKPEDVVVNFERDDLMPQAAANQPVPPPPGPPSPAAAAALAKVPQKSGVYEITGPDDPNYQLIPVGSAYTDKAGKLRFKS